MKKRSYFPALPLLCLLSLSLTACGSSGTDDPTATGAEHTTATSTVATPQEPQDVRRLRDVVVRGVATDFRFGTGAGPTGFGLCLRLGMRRALSAAKLNRLVSVYRRPEGQPLAAQALNAIAAPIGKKCGGAKFVPELVAASRALGGDYPLSRLDAAARRLGITYGPYIGVSCRRPGPIHCDRVGFDVVLRRDAVAVTAWVGGRRLRLRTPGLHNGVAGKDWVGFLDDVGLNRPDSPFHIPSNGHRPIHWAGSPPVYLPVRIVATYPGDGRVTARLAGVFLSPGFG
jgi:hypothetical protein